MKNSRLLFYFGLALVLTGPMLHEQQSEADNHDPSAAAWENIFPSILETNTTNPGKSVEAQGTSIYIASPEPGSNNPTNLFPSIVARGKRVLVTRAMLDEAATLAKSSKFANGRPCSKEQMLVVECQTLRRLIQIQLLLAKATDADKAASKEIIEKLLAEIKARAGSQETFLERQLQQTGLSREQFAAKMIEEETAKMTLRHNINAKVTEEEAKKLSVDARIAYIQEIQKQTPAYLERLWKEDGVEILDVRLKENLKEPANGIAPSNPPGLSSAAPPVKPQASSPVSTQQNGSRP